MVRRSGIGMVTRVVCLIAIVAVQAPARGSDMPGLETISAEERVVFPSSPATPRIEYIGSLKDNAAYRGKQRWWHKVTRLVAGSSEATALDRPYGVEAAGDKLYVCDTALGVVHCFDTAGDRYTQIPKDGRLASPIDVAVDREGYVYVTDSQAGTVNCYRRDGELERVVAGDLLRPTGIAHDATTDRLFVVDTKAHAVRSYTPTGEPTGSFGERGEDAGQFNFPVSIFIDRAGIVFVTDSMNFRIQAFTLDGTALREFGSLGDRPGYFSKPKGVATDSDGNVYVVDAIFDAVQVFDADGNLLLSFGSAGHRPGEFWLPTGITVDEADRIYVSDSFNHRVQVFQYLKE